MMVFSDDSRRGVMEGRFRVVNIDLIEIRVLGNKYWNRGGRKVCVVW